MTKMKRKIRKSSKRNVQWIAAAVLSAALLSGQVMPVIAQNSSSVIAVSAIIPENITIDTPVPLSDISLPKSEYGKLSWADDTQIPSKRAEAFEVVFTPAESFDLSRIDGWDGISEKITGYVTVVVSSIESSGGSGYEDSAEESREENSSQETSESDAEAEVPAQEEQNPQENQDTSVNSGDPDADTAGKEQEAPDEADVQEPAEDTQTGETEESSEAPSDKQEQTDIQNGQEKTPADADPKEPSQEDSEDLQEETTDQPSEDENGQAPENGDEKIPDGDGAQTEPETDAPEEEQPDDTAVPSETPDAPDQTVEIPDNIFDRADEEIIDERPVTAEEDLTEEEMVQRAEENHSCDGISVSGINLPWYVQFRATSGESYEFTNESQANIFRSYEFELWDLQNNTEYEIPDGEYISVTIPVKEGYEYTIEHLLDNGATETIIPSVSGSIMTFSTHSFSPFGIAGSKTLVGEEVVENNYVTPTPTSIPTKAPSTAGGNTSGNNTGGSNTGANGTGSGNSGGNTTSGNTNGGGTGSSTGGSGNGSTGSSNNGSSGSGGTSSGSQNNGTAQNNQQSSANTSGQNTSSARAVQTGDNTQILPFVILVIAAAVIIGAALFLKRKKK